MPEEKPTYTKDQVAQNNGQNGARTWIIIRSVVYDVTDYLDEHPGGAELLGEYAGGDATRGFDDFGHSSDAVKKLKRFEIGTFDKMAKNGNDNKGSSKGVKFSNGHEADDSADAYKKSKKRRKFLRLIIGQCGSG
ncbi:hypothetical protein TKK_0012848 [Trichogramma kaykai]|uniref:Cytochrome b5 heme-binding domain-containing protein n=1 Tax=Trichogramma kaykai TaxID=54128 RepID=A0ABD2WLK9_9HYME